ncbi:uncharacterized protein LOC130768995 isoform X2 [Actinidia eriantha]|uniref:uncharacterized protein LOC130768995 isoform X2 n=1 Tax=Actinidia eriantha TaxID=165200 RepID=UPI00258F279F|nr:uncharacterized protein LOC130768995 isoform X2 [Actinidia eriantha]XP_057482070.1 uncharacterized protein LOC130768995 isoform X2 [Actinidia eriantha]
MDNLTIFGNLDENLEETFLRQRNKVVIIRDEREYNAIRLSEEKEKTKTNASTSSKGKEITTSSTKSVPSDNVISKFVLAQRTRREREKSLKCIQRTLFPNLTPRRRRRNWLEGSTNTTNVINSTSVPTGVTVLGGDFRQVLPVIPKGVREQIVAASLRRSILWHDIHVLTLDVNMRLNNTDVENINFANFLMEIGSNPREIVKLPSTIHSCRNLNQLLSRVYPQLDVPGTVSPTFLTERTILCARNEHVTAINIATLNIFPGEPTTYLAADKMSEDDEVDRNITNRYPNEYLNSLNPPGLPPFKVELKVGCPIMLLRNIAPNDGLCNGTRLMVVRCASRIIEAQILTGDKRGNLVFIPRISLTPSSSKFPFRMTRRQFPIRLAYAMTINKSQGQSVKYVGIDLRTPVFSHGQLYVALSRCTTFHRISVLPEQEMDSTTNIVYPEVLL